MAWFVRPFGCTSAPALVYIVGDMRFFFGRRCFGTALRNGEERNLPEGWRCCLSE